MKLENKITTNEELSKNYIEWEKCLSNYFFHVKLEKNQYGVMHDLLHLMNNKFVGINRELENQILEMIKVIILYRNYIRERKYE